MGTSKTRPRSVSLTPAASSACATRSRSEISSDILRRSVSAEIEYPFGFDVRGFFELPILRRFPAFALAVVRKLDRRLPRRHQNECWNGHDHTGYGPEETP
jgi:hypothetical protein